MDKIKKLALFVLAFLTLYTLSYTIGALTIPVLIILFLIAYFILKKRERTKQQTEIVKRHLESELEYPGKEEIPSEPNTHNINKQIQEKHKRSVQPDSTIQLQSEKKRQPLSFQKEPDPYQIADEELTIALREATTEQEKKQIMNEREALRQEKLIKSGKSSKNDADNLKLLKLAIAGAERARKRLDSKVDSRAMVLEKLVKQLNDEYTALLQKAPKKQVQRNSLKAKKARNKLVHANDDYEKESTKKQRVRV